jgi:hypothetical protein
VLQSAEARAHQFHVLSKLHMTETFTSDAPIPHALRSTLDPSTARWEAFSLANSKLLYPSTNAIQTLPSKMNSTSHTLKRIGTSNESNNAKPSCMIPTGFQLPLDQVNVAMSKSKLTLINEHLLPAHIAPYS